MPSTKAKDAVTTIDLDNDGIHVEATLNGAASPGMNVVLESDGRVAAGNGTAGAALPRIVKEDAQRGLTVDDALADGDVASFVIPRRGRRVAIRVTDGVAVAIGSLLSPVAAGTFSLDATATAMVQAEEALASDGTDRLISARTLK